MTPHRPLKTLIYRAVIAGHRLTDDRPATKRDMVVSCRRSWLLLLLLWWWIAQWHFTVIFNVARGLNWVVARWHIYRPL